MFCFYTNKLGDDFFIILIQKIMENINKSLYKKYENGITSDIITPDLSKLINSISGCSEYSERNKYFKIIKKGGGAGLRKCSGQYGRRPLLCSIIKYRSQTIHVCILVLMPSEAFKVDLSGGSREHPLRIQWSSLVINAQCSLRLSIWNNGFLKK